MERLICLSALEVRGGVVGRGLRTIGLRSKGGGGGLRCANSSTPAVFPHMFGCQRPCMLGRTLYTFAPACFHALCPT